MSNKYKAKVKRPGDTYTDAYIEAENRFDAEKLLKAQYVGCDVDFIEEIETESTTSESKKGGCGSIVIVLIAVLAYGAWEAITNQKPSVSSAPQPAAQISAAGDQPMPGADIPENPQTPIEEPQVAEDTQPAPLPPPESEPEPPARKLSVLATEISPQIAPPAARTLKTYVFQITDQSGRPAEVELKARDENDARRILRDYRGNPDVVSMQEAGN